MIQFALVSLIPGLITALNDCADPELDSYATRATKPTSLKSSDRQSLLAYVGLPIQIFGKGSLFGPYTPLQQLDVLADFGTKSYVVGSTNALLLQQKDRYSDIIVNLDETAVICSSPSLRTALSLTAADRRWIDLIYNDVAADWDPENPSRPRNLGFKGSEEYIRILFEQYIIALLSSVKFHLYFNSLPAHKRSLSAFPNYDTDPSLDFGEAWIDMWKKSYSFKIWSRLTDSHLFDVVDPRHPTAGGFTVDDFNRRLAQELQELHLDERFATSKEALSKSLVEGQKKVSTAINNIWADIEARRAVRGKSPSRAEDHETKNPLPSPNPLSASNLSVPVTSPSNSTANATLSPSAAVFDTAAMRARAPDLSAAQAALGTAGQKAGAYFSSWSSWANEKKKSWSKPKEEEELPLPMNVGASDSITLGARTFEAMLAGPSPKGRGETPTVRKVETSENEKPAGSATPSSPGPQSPTSPKTPKSPRRQSRQAKSKEQVGSDGIGRLDA
jgi:Transport protein Avl9